MNIVGKTLTLILKSILIIAITSIVLIIYATFIERHLLISKKYKLDLNENGKENLRIVQFTDTQLGEFYSLDQLGKVVEKVNKLNPDVVVFTGDLIDNASTYNEKNKVSDVLKKINAKLGKYAIYGNHDYGGGAVRYYEDIMNKSGFKVLKNSSEKIEKGERIINIFGTDDALMGNPSISKTINSINENNINILLVHEPDLIDRYTKYPIDLALSGHSHGGQVYIPFYGPAKKNSLSQNYNKGMYGMDNYRKTKLFVSSGLGNTKVPFRFLNIPEVVVFDLKI